MGSDWGKGQEEGLSGFCGVVEEAETLLRDEVGVVLVCVLDWRILVALEDGREVFICAGVHEEVLEESVSDALWSLLWKSAYGTIKSSWIRIVVVGGRMRVEQFPRVVGAVSCFLQPDGEVFVVETAIYEFWVATCVRQTAVLRYDEHSPHHREETHQ